MVDKTIPYAKYWHVKNYIRIEDSAQNAYMTYPAPLVNGLINYRYAIRKAIELGFKSAFLCEHYGGDGLSISAQNREYLRSILPR